MNNASKIFTPAFLQKFGQNLHNTVVNRAVSVYILQYCTLLLLFLTMKRFSSWVSQDNLSLNTLKGGQGGQGGGRGQQGGVGGRAGDVMEVVVLFPNFNLIMAKHLLTKAMGVTLPRPTCSRL